MTLKVGNLIALKILKWLSSDTRKSTLDTKAQSAYLLSSGSLCISPQRYVTCCKVTLSSERSSFITLSATNGLVFSPSFSWYSKSISLLINNSYLPDFSASKIGRYLDLRGKDINNIFISNTTLIDSQKNEDAQFSNLQSFGHSSPFHPITCPSPGQFSGRNSRLIFSLYPLFLHQKHQKDTVSIVPIEGY